MSSDDRDNPSAPGSNPISAPSRTPARSKRRMPAATLDYGAAMNRLDVLLLDADGARAGSVKGELTGRGRSVVIVKDASEATRVCEGMRPVVLLVALSALSDGDLTTLEEVVRSPGGDKIALLAFDAGAKSAPEGGPPVLSETTPKALVDELARRWPSPAF
jgi:hypothetical protein